MIIGVSVSDFALLVKAARKAYHRWNSAYGHYSSITASLKDFCFHLEEVSRAVDDELYSLLSNRQEYVLQWESLHSSCLETVTRVRAMMNKHEMGRTRQGNWKRLGLAVDASKIEELEGELRHQRTKLSSFVSTLTLPAIWSSINTMAAQMRRGNETVLSGWTTYTNDDPTQWRELRHTLHERYRHKRTALRLHKAAIMAYVNEAHEKGEFEEDSHATEGKDGDEVVELENRGHNKEQNGLEVQEEKLNDLEQRESTTKLRSDDLATIERPKSRASSPRHEERDSQRQNEPLAETGLSSIARGKQKQPTSHIGKAVIDARKSQSKTAPRRRKSFSKPAAKPPKAFALRAGLALASLLEGKRKVSIVRKPLFETGGRRWYGEPRSTGPAARGKLYYKNSVTNGDGPATSSEDSSSEMSDACDTSAYDTSGDDTSGYDTSGYDTSAYDSDSSSGSSVPSERVAIAVLKSRGALSPGTNQTFHAISRARKAAKVSENLKTTLFSPVKRL